MPFTLLAHQAPAIPFKMARPKWFDGTALCIASMAPDLGYSVSGYLHADTHAGWGVLTISLPIAAVMTVLARYSAADVCAQLPDLGGFRLRSWGVIGSRWPRWWITASSVVLGLLTHLVLDGFTHQGRWGPRLLHYRNVRVHMAGHSLGLASALQLAGHVFGAAVAVWLMWRIARRDLLSRWYTPADMQRAADAPTTRHDLVVFWAVVVLVTGSGIAWGSTGSMLELATRSMVAAAIGAVGGAALIRRSGRSGFQVV